MKVEKFKSAAMLSTSSSVGLLEKHDKIQKIIFKHEKIFNKMCKAWHLYMNGMIDVFSDKVKFIKHLENIRVTLHSYKSLKPFFDHVIRELLEAFYKELITYGQKNKLAIKMHVTIGSNA